MSTRSRRDAAARRAKVRAGLLALAVVAVAVVVVVVVASGGDDAVPPLDVATSPRVELVGVEMAFEPAEVAVAAGEVEIVLHNEGSVDHDVSIVGVPGLVEAGPGETAARTFTLAPGRYEMFCTLPGHREGGMRAALEVRPG